MSTEVELLNFTMLSLDEKKMVLSWRNDRSVRKWMYTQDLIELDSHLNFIETLKESKDKVYFLVKTNNEYMGVIDFTQITNNSAHIGLYANPQFKGIGQLLMDKIIEYGFNTMGKKVLVAEALEINQKAYELYKKNYFIERNRKTINNLNVICMELKNENRKV